MAVASAPVAAPAEDRLDRRTLIISGVVIIGSVMSILDATVVNVALQTLSADFGAPLSSIQWVVSAYTLALASVIPIAGWATDRYGAKRLWLGAVAVFVAGSMLCAVAWSVESLIAFRVLQGIGGGIIMPVGTTVIARQAGPERMGRVMAVMGVPMLLGPVLGPVVGGLLIDSASWHWIFLINLPIGALALTLGVRLLPAPEPQPGARLDVVGLALLSPGLVGLIYGLSEASGSGGIGAPAVWLPAAAGVALIAAFVVRSLRSAFPLIDVRLFGGRAFSAAAATTFALGVASFGAMLLLPLYFQQVRGEGVLRTGLLTAPQGLGMALAMTLSGRAADRLGAGRVVPVGLGLSLVATLMLTQLTDTTSYWTLGGLLVVLGAGLGASMMPAMAAAYATLDRAGVARATVGLQIVQRVGSTIGAALFAVVLSQRIGDTPGVTPAAAADAFASTFWWGVGLTALALIPALLLPRRHAPVVPASSSDVRPDCQPLAGNGAGLVVGSA